MSVMYDLSYCCICLCKEAENLCSKDTTNSWISKLRKCVSEIDWSEEYLICGPCKVQLDIVYAFYLLCIQSHKTRQRTEQNIVGSNIEAENSDDADKYEKQNSHDCLPQSVLNKSQSDTGEIQAERRFCELCCLRFEKQSEFNSHYKTIHSIAECTEESIIGAISNDDSESGSDSSSTQNYQESTICSNGNLENENCRLSSVTCDTRQQYTHDEPVEKIIKKRKRNNEFICEMCKQIFTTSTKLIWHAVNEHNISKNDIKPFACAKCPLRFNKSWGLITHTRSHNRVSKDPKLSSCFICEICKVNFDSNKALICHCTSTHKMNEKDIRSYSCMQCTQKFTNALRLRSHMKEHNINEKHTTKNSCHDSDERSGLSKNNTDSIPTGNSQNASRKKKNTFTCEICGFSFSYCTELVKHMVKEHKMDKKDVKPFKCIQCSKRFDKNTLLLQHMKFHDGIRNAICPYCGKAFITKGELHIHEKTHLNKREYQCTLCPKRFNTSGDRNRHKLVVHTDPSFWKYICNICAKRLPSKSHYDTHMRRHNNDKPFACHLCEKRFCDKIVLQKHLRSHSNVRPYKCSECEKEYKDERTMQLHMARIHKTGNIKVPDRIKKYICHLCPKSYYDKGKLTKHLYSHTGERPFACSICNKKFTDKSYVKHHMKTVHSFVADAVELSG